MIKDYAGNVLIRERLSYGYCMTANPEFNKPLNSTNHCVIIMRQSYYMYVGTDQAKMNFNTPSGFRSKVPVWLNHSKLRALGVAVTLLLSGCAGLEVQDSFFTDNQGEEAAAQPEVVSQIPERPFDPETLYDLMVAEVAAYDHRFDLALGNYLQHAHHTKDEGVTERAYQIASFMNARQAAGDAARLWMRIAPKNPEAIKADSIEKAWSGDLVGALDGLSKARESITAVPFNFVAVQAAGTTEPIRRKLLVRFDSLLKKYPGDESLQIGRAMLLHQLDELNAALSQVNSLLAKSKEQPQALLLKGRILHQQGKEEQAVNLLKDAVKTHPDVPRLRLLYARVLVKLGDLTGAQKEFEILVQQQPSNPELLLSVALIAMENGMPGEAGFYLHRLSKIKGNENVSEFYLGRLAEQMDDWKEGRKHYLKVTPGKQFISAYASLVRMLTDHEQWAMAREDLKEGREKYPEHAVQLYMLEGENLIEQREYDAAAEVYDEAMKNYPDDVSLLYARAMLAEKLNDLDRLESDLKKIIASDPDNAAALNALGYTLADRTDRYAEAQRLISQAYALQPDDPSIIDSLGWVEYRLGNYEKALEYLKKAYSQFPDAEVAAHLGEVLWAMNRKDEARKVWDEALERQPDSEILKATTERLLNSGSE
ncbi:tetratricopeptide repeat protein [Sansalvadorimonas sp. 2012CJ34-2]|uniref:Tetratricopeptide repeat protein n=1 Tax=Parendozoicomonas callyspongiae TaxID=2942213 RepID=A0ABT0PH58_9GAMM|nr:tetratricopeptide repeat protein [Sansalvadorimonas sp. 2012CJ34-2]MCL6270341.1 tetratricopeptide repeat protein [Sansalvadorimonas sp. 2012CJ34-2]